MKTKTTKILLLVLVIALALMVLASCGKDSTIEISIKDGDTTIDTISITDGTTINVEELKARNAIQKTGYEVSGFYLDPELSEIFIAEEEITANLTIFVKYIPKTYTIGVNTDGGNKIEKITLAKDADYSIPTPVKDGYDFAGYKYLDDDAVERDFPQTGTYSFDHNVVVTAKWTIKQFDVAFYDGTEKVDSIKKNYGTTISLQDISKPGYNFVGWFEKDENGDYYANSFDNTTLIQKNINLYAKFSPKTFTITVKDWHEASIQVVYGQTYTLVNPADTTDPKYIAKVGTDEDHEWSTFTGYTYNNEAFPYTGVYNFTTNIEVDPISTPNTNYNKVTITFWDSIENVAFDSVKILNGESLDAENFPTSTITNKAAYDFVGWYTTDTYTLGTEFTTTSVVTENTKVYSKYNPKNFVITIKDTDENGNIITTVDVVYNSSYDLGTAPEKLGVTFAGYIYNNNVFAATGTYTYTTNIVVYATFEETNELGNFIVKDNYFKEREQSTDPFTYVFLTGVEYSFSGYEISSTANGTKIFIGNDKSKFTAMAPGEFIFEAKKTSDNTVSSISAKVVYDIASMTVSGDSYNNMISNATNGTSFQTAVANKSDYVMTVGKDNFIPEVSILNDSTSAINLEQANIQITSNSELTTAINGSAITFSGVSDDVVTLTLTPKYVFSNISAQIKVKINNGVNVYDNATFKAAYSNESVQTINVLRNITALLEDSDYEELHPRQTGNITLKTTNGQTVVLENRDIGTPLNKYWGGVYRRTTESDDDNLVINGNYFTIDGSKLPYIDTILDRTAGVGYNLGNVQIGMFLYRCAKVDGTTANNDIDYRKVTGHVSFNNLKIEGNNIPAYAGATVNVPGEDLPLIKMSTAFNGIVCRGGTVNLDNVSVFNTNIALFLDGGVSGYENPGLGGTYDGVSGQVQANETQAISLNVTNSLVNYSWANSVYAYNLCKVQLTNTKIGTSSGAAIHFDDKPYGGATDGSNGFSNLRSELKLDLYTSTNINNWVAGDEPWFVAYNMTGPATTIKTDMEAGANAKGLTILKEFTGTSKMNFALVVNPCQTDKVTAWANYCGGINPAIVKDELLIDEGGNPTQMGTQFWYNSTALCSFFDGSVAETTTISTNAGLANGGNIDALAANSPFIYDGSQHIGVYIKAYKYVPPQEP